MCVVDKIKNIPTLYYKGPVLESEILDASMKLGLDLPQEYINYIRALGYISFCGHVFTGLGIKDKPNVVLETKTERLKNKSLPLDMIVLETTDVPGVCIVMDMEGAVYLLQHETLRKVSDTLSEYIDFLI